MDDWYDWGDLYYVSPQSELAPTDPGNNSTYDEAAYLARPAGNWGPSFQSQQIQGPTYGSSDNNNYGSDYFMDAFGYQVKNTGETYAPAVAPSEPVTYGAGEWVDVNGTPTYVAQPLPSTDWPTREQV